MISFFFLRLYLAHILGDFPLQTDYIFRLKTRRKNVGAVPHILIHFVVMFLFMLPFIYSWRVLGSIVFISLIHFLSDTKKVDVNKILQQNKQSPYNQLLYFMVDQLIHLLTILLAVLIFFFPAYYLEPMRVFPDPFFNIYIRYDELIIVLIFIVLGVFGTQALVFNISGLFFDPQNINFKESWKVEFMEKLYRFLIMILFLLPGNFVCFALVPVGVNIVYILLKKHQESYSYFKNVVTTLLSILLAIIMRSLFYYY